MRVAVMTLWHSNDNYGQVLQCWALQQTLKALGHEPCCVRYKYDRYSLPLIRRARYLDTPDLLDAIRMRVKKQIAYRADADSDCGELSLLGKTRDDERDFDGFRAAHINFTVEKYHSIEDLGRFPPRADCYMVGSDQVWGGSVTGADSAAMHLDFAPENSKRIAYAASIGRKLSASEWRRLAARLKKFDALGVRERDTAEWLSREGLRAEHVLDPTLLLEASDYERIMPPSKIDAGSRCMLAYLINVATSNELPLGEMSEYVASRGLELVPVYSSGYIPARRLIPDVEPHFPAIPYWLRSLESAACVVTSSFHGAVFSIVYHKQFLVIFPKGVQAKGNSRLAELLDELDINERVYDATLSFRKQIDAPIDWEIVDCKLGLLRRESLGFLGNALRC